MLTVEESPPERISNAQIVHGNAYILRDSCHYQPWLENTPKGQLLRLRINCTYENNRG